MSSLADFCGIRARTVEDLVNPILTGYDINNFDYYIYNNRAFTPVQVDTDDIVEPHERLLHICLKNTDPQTDRFLRPYSLYNISDLYQNLSAQMC